MTITRIFLYFHFFYLGTQIYMDCSVVSMKGQTETEKLDRDIRLWSSGKETDIRLLLSTLHHVTFSLLLIF